MGGALDECVYALMKRFSEDAIAQVRHDDPLSGETISKDKRFGNLVHTHRFGSVDNCHEFQYEGRMAYNQFSLHDVKQRLGVTIRETVDLFGGIAPITPSSLLQETLRDSAPIALAISTEKSRSEMIITPILLEVRRCHKGTVALFSGTEFNVDEARGLVGYCDWLLTRSPEQLAIEAPVLAVVEAKNENIRQGVPQCVAEMVAAQSFNAQQGQDRTVYGAITTGDTWRFLRLRGSLVEIDLTMYYLHELEKVLGILIAMTAGDGT